MSTKNLQDMTNKEILKYIEDEYGVKLPEKTTRTDLFARLKELQGDTAPVAPGENSGDKNEGKKGLPKQVSITIHESDDPRNYVVVGFNGRNYQIKKGEPVTVPYGVYEILNNAVEDLYTTVKKENGDRELVKRSKHRHAFSVNEKIFG